MIASSVAHLNTDENGAPERVGGIKVLPAACPDGKLTPEVISAYAPNPDEVQVRWMCSWDTQPADVDAFAAAVVSLA